MLRTSYGLKHEHPKPLAMSCMSASDLMLFLLQMSHSRCMLLGHDQASPCSGLDSGSLSRAFISFSSASASASVTTHLSGSPSVMPSPPSIFSSASCAMHRSAAESLSRDMSLSQAGSTTWPGIATRGIVQVGNVGITVKKGMSPGSHTCPTLLLSVPLASQPRPWPYQIQENHPCLRPS